MASASRRGGCFPDRSTEYLMVLNLPSGKEPPMRVASDDARKCAIDRVTESISLFRAKSHFGVVKLAGREIPNQCELGIQSFGITTARDQLHLQCATGHFSRSHRVALQREHNECQCPAFLCIKLFDPMDLDGNPLACKSSFYLDGAGRALKIVHAAIGPSPIGHGSQSARVQIEQHTQLTPQAYKCVLRQKLNSIITEQLFPFRPGLQERVDRRKVRRFNCPADVEYEMVEWLPKFGL